VVLALALALEAVGCAGNLFGLGRPSRKEAIAHCIEVIPAESALYADHFSACMEQQGWMYAPEGG
jgi:hypothetical protein